MKVKVVFMVDLKQFQSLIQFEFSLILHLQRFLPLFLFILFSVSWMAPLGLASEPQPRPCLCPFAKQRCCQWPCPESKSASCCPPCDSQFRTSSSVSDVVCSSPEKRLESLDACLSIWPPRISHSSSYELLDLGAHRRSHWLPQFRWSLC